MLHFIEVLDLDIADVSVDVDDNRNRYRSFGRTDPDGEQGKEETFQLSREQEAVEHGKVNIDRVQNQFHADEHGQQVTSGKEPVDAYKHHEGGNHQI